MSEEYPRAKSTDVDVSYFPTPAATSLAMEAAETMHRLIKLGMRPAYTIPVGGGSYVIWLPDPSGTCQVPR